MREIEGIEEVLEQLRPHWDKIDAHFNQENERFSILAPNGAMKLVQHSPTLRIIGTFSAEEVQRLIRPKTHRFSEGSIRGHFRSETRRRA